MAESTMQALEDAFPEVVAQMGEFFDSHDFILKLAHAQQRLYVTALAAVDSEHPFQIVHREISRRLLAHPELVSRIGERSSRDIFGQKSSATVWCKMERKGRSRAKKR
jgi:hypothetical protein